MDLCCSGAADWPVACPTQRVSRLGKHSVAAQPQDDELLQKENVGDLLTDIISSVLLINFGKDPAPRRVLLAQ